MSKTSALVSTVLAAAISLLVAPPAVAGASASAPSKYSQGKQVVAVHHTSLTRPTGQSVTEFSSASKTSSPKR
jgi:hypothetical protein